MLVTGAGARRPILFKTVFYWAAVLVARLLEHWIRFWLVEHHPLGTFLPHMIATFDWHRCIAIQLWIFVLFLIYETATVAQSPVRRR